MPEAWHARSSNGVDASTWAMAYGSDGTLFLIRRVEFHLLELKIIDLSQRLVRTRAIDLAKFGIIVDESLEQAPVFAIRGGTAYLAIDNVVLVMDTKVTGIEASAPISALILSRQHVRDRMIVSHAEGGTIFWGAKYDGREERFCHDAEHPVIGITQSGLLIAVTANRIEVYRAHDGHLKLRNEADYSGERPLAVLATASPDEFAVFERSGRVRVYRVPV
jgi:hypothetical protein